LGAETLAGSQDCAGQASAPAGSTSHRGNDAMTELETVLRLANELQPEKLPHFLGQLEEAKQVARMRLTPAAPAPVPPDVLLSVRQAAQKLNCSADTLYKRDFPFVRRIGRKRLFSQNGIEEYLCKQK
jgi:hypothetical protein